MTKDKSLSRFLFALIVLGLTDKSDTIQSSRIQCPQQLTHPVPSTGQCSAAFFELNELLSNCLSLSLVTEIHSCPRYSQLKRVEICFSSQLQSVVSWLRGRQAWWKGLAEESSSHHGSPEAERKGRSRGGREVLPGHDLISPNPTPAPYCRSTALPLGQSSSKGTVYEHIRSPNHTYVRRIYTHT